MYAFALEVCFHFFPYKINILKSVLYWEGATQHTKRNKHLSSICSKMIHSNCLLYTFIVCTVLAKDFIVQWKTLRLHLCKYI